MPNKALVAIAAVAITFIALHAPRAAAYPIPPRTLTTQVEEADAVVFARVERVEQRKPDPDAEGPGRWVDAVAHLRIERVLKGKLEEERVQVSYSAGMICPAPARFEEGELALVFLGKDELVGWIPKGLSYATLYPAPDELGAFAKAVHRAAGLLEKDAGPEEMRAFFVDLAVDPATRWHGLYELRSNAFLMSHYDRKPKAHRALDDEELHRLAEAFLASPAEDTIAMLRVLKDVDDPRIEATAARLAEVDLKKKAGFETAQLLEALADRVGFEMPKPSYDEKVEPILGDPLLQRMKWNDAASQRALLQAILKRVDPTRAVELPERRAPRVSGVGGETPP